MTAPPIAVIGMACRYADAASPGELWENVLAQRRAFRRIPRERLSAEDYFSPDRSAPDRAYAFEAAVIDGYEFDRVRFRVGGGAFRSADMTHWLALDIADRALADAGFEEADGLPRATTGVLVGNTLTGEFSRANTLRLRWPYVRRVVDAALAEHGQSPEERRAFLDGLERAYKAPFPPVDEDTLAGGLSNTIAGRICNHFDLRGGGYTVDGACSASLLAVATACSALAAGDLDVALAGGVDLSIDPFELVGFAKAGALAGDQMRVYDARSAGFWPGEGCGFVVLARYDDALSAGRRIHALIRGWGVSSDGSGGMTRPEAEGQMLALERAYRRAGFGPETVAYFEGHGTGTAVGDGTELRALSRARGSATPEAPPAAIGSVKANVGHTKAAAGVAGLIKAAMALQRQIVPPTTGCTQPHAEIAGPDRALAVQAEGRLWPAEAPLRAGVSAMGFGGINAHVVLESPAIDRRAGLDPLEQSLLSSAQDAEVFLLSGRDADDLRGRIEHLLGFAARLSRAELGDLAAALAGRLDAREFRAAVVASEPAELADGLNRLRSWLADGAESRLDTRAGLSLGRGGRGRVGFLFPGQASPTYRDAGALGRRFASARAPYIGLELPTGDDRSTAVAQPAIVAASLAALRVLRELGVEACVGVGHSLGELAALYWAGTFDEAAALRIAAQRGRSMSELSGPRGAMASIGGAPDRVRAWLDDRVVIAALNAPEQTVVSGHASAVDAVVERARAQGLDAVRLPVSHAFHSPLMAGAVSRLTDILAEERLRPPERSVVSTVTGALLRPDDDLRALLVRQVTDPVRLAEAVASASRGVDLLVEVGPGHVLSGLVAGFADPPVVALDSGGPSLRGLLQAVGAAFALGAAVDPGALFAGRFTRPFDLDWRPRFFANPCELAPRLDQRASRGAEQPAESLAEVAQKASADGATPATSPLELLRQLVAARGELPPSAVRPDDHLLGDLHLSSIAVSQIVAEAARRLGLPPPVAPTDYASATVASVAQALADLTRTGGGSASATIGPPPGVEAWVRAFTVELTEGRRPRARPRSGAGRVLGPPGHPLVASLARALGDRDAVVVCLPRDPGEGELNLLLEGARAAVASASRFVLVQQGGGAASFAKTLHLEVPGVDVCVVDVPFDTPDAVAAWVAAETDAAVGYVEAHYDRAGTRRRPVLRPLQPRQSSGAIPLEPEDVVLVTGGGKGIAAECALSLARETGCRLALIGRSDPAVDRELAANLERIAAGGVTVRYVRADVGDRPAVVGAVRGMEAVLGPVTALVHGAGINEPRLLRELDRAAVLRTLGPKVEGVRNVLAALDPERLRLFVAFGSVIARTGMRGEADYALANEWLSREVERWQTDHPRCRCLAVEWSVWSGVGMGERLGRVDALAREGITAISPDAGVAMLRDLLIDPPPVVSVVVAGRLGDAPTMQLAKADLPFLRFLERPRVHYPGIELVVEADLSVDTDPYLADHVFEGERLFPAVMGLEAIAQAAMALMGTTTRPSFEDVRFDRAVVVPATGSRTLRVAALARAPDRVEVVLRSDETDFQADHFRATCRFGREWSSSLGSRRLGADPPEPAPPLVPERDLYGPLLFHGPRFRRLRGYRRLRATECSAEITTDATTAWFGAYLPGGLVLGDPAARDAAIHAIQACIPQATLLPVGVDRLRLAADAGSGPWRVHARERSRDGDTFVYDLELTGRDSRVHERWEALRLRAVAGSRPSAAWAEPLLGPYVERRLGELLPGARATVAVERNGHGRHPQSDRMMQRAVGTAAAVRRRPDGKPEVNGQGSVSCAHAADLILAVAGPGTIACDVEPIRPRPPSVWRDLLGVERLTLAEVIRREAGEDLDTAATRAWTAGECLRKAGQPPDAPLVLGSSTTDGWVLMSSGRLDIASFATPFRGADGPAVLAVLLGGDDARL